MKRHFRVWSRIASFLILYLCIFTICSSLSFAQDIILYVNGSTGRDTPKWGTSESKSFATIGYAIKNIPSTASSADSVIIRIASGTYNEAINITKYRVWLEGVSKDNTVISGNSTSAVVSIIGPLRVGVKQLSLTGGKYGISSDNATVEISDVLVNNNLEYGLYLYGNANAYVDTSQFTQNGNGVTLARNSSIRMTNSSASNNTGTGIQFWYSSSGSVDGTTVSSNGAAGIQVGSGSSARLTNNTVSNNALIGIDATQSSSVYLLGGNNIFGNADYSGWRSGVGAHHGSTAIFMAQSGNPHDYIHNNHGPGVFAGSNSEVFLPTGTIENNEGDGVGLTIGSVAHLEGNTKVRSNAGYGIGCGNQSYAWIKPDSSVDLSGNTSGQTNCW